MFKQTFLFFLFFPTLLLIFKLDFRKLGMELMFILASSDSVKVIVVRSEVAPLSSSPTLTTEAGLAEVQAHWG